MVQGGDERDALDYKGEEERGADKKNEEATRSVEGMPSDERRRAAARAAPLSLPERFSLHPLPSR